MPTAQSSNKILYSQSFYERQPERAIIQLTDISNKKKEIQ